MGLREEPVEKLCPRCGQEMWIVDIPASGRLWQCASCRVSMQDETLYEWRRQVAEPEKQLNVRTMNKNRYLSSKPCPECHKPMWAISEPGYGTRHQCEECRLTVMFGGAVAKWRNLPKGASPS